MKLTALTRRSLLRTALATTALAAPFVAYAAGSDAPGTDRVLAWHSDVTPLWLNPQKHYRVATPDNFLSVVHASPISILREDLYGHLALNERLGLDPRRSGSACTNEGRALAAPRGK